MEWPDQFAAEQPSLKRELQGPRPPPLRVRKDSRMIKKPPLAPPQQPPHHHHQIRQPVIIYTVSPKVIHVKACDFSSMVQQLTGSSSSTTTTTTTTSSSYVGASGAISPAARLAAMEKANPSENQKARSCSTTTYTSTDSRMRVGDGFEDLGVSDQLMITGSFPGILSPLPSSLPPISPNFFSGLPDPSSITYFHDLNQIFHGNINTTTTTTGLPFVPSPQTALISPTPFFDLLNQFLDS